MGTLNKFAKRSEGIESESRHMFCKCVLLITRLLLLVGRLCPHKPVLPHQWGDCCYSTDRPKSVRNRCVIEVFGSVFLCCYVAF